MTNEETPTREKLSAEKFLSYFERTILQTFYDPDSATHPAPWFTKYDPIKLKRLNEQKYGIYFSVNAFDKIRDGEHLVKLNAVYSDIDVSKEGSGDTQAEITQKKILVFKELEKLSIKPNIISVTKNGLHAIWFIEDPGTDENTRAEYTQTIKGIIEWSKTYGSKGDKVYDIPRVLRLPGFYHQKSDPFLIESYLLHEDKTTLQKLSKLFPYFDEEKILNDNAQTNKQLSVLDLVSMEDVALAALKEYGEPNAYFDSKGRIWLDRGVTGAFLGKHDDGQYIGSNSHELPYGNKITFVRRLLKLEDNKAAFAWIAKEFNLPSKIEVETVKLPWPSPLNEAAYYGLAGRLVKLVELETEADPAAVLIGLLATFGSIAGSKPYIQVGPVRHGLRLFVAIVGKSAKSRKGVALAEDRRFFTGIDLDWEKKRIVPSCSSGEGIIHNLRDQIIKVDENGDEKIIDPGVDDKRLFIEADELASTLQTMARPGNTLSPIIRLAWDGRTLRTVTKNNAEEASNPHVAILSDITEMELKKLLTEVDLYNGLANRFLFIAAKRSRELALGGNVSILKLGEFKNELAKAVNFAKTTGEITLDTQAREAWIKIYHDLTGELPGLVGVLSARTEPYTLRLAAIYALLDEKTEIQLPHLRAAVAVMDYATETLFHLFGDSIGDPVAEKIMEALSQNPEGLSREEIRDLFYRNKSSSEISFVLENLEKLGRVKKNTQQTAGRSKTIYTLSASTAFTAYYNFHKSYLKKLDNYIEELGFNNNLDTNPVKINDNQTTGTTDGNKPYAVNAKNAVSQDTPEIKEDKFDINAPVPKEFLETRKGKQTPMGIGYATGNGKIVIKPIPGVPESLEEI